ncbi:MAG: GNAT family N-acetyltransferase [Planctomycetota bacterium]
MRRLRRGDEAALALARAAGAHGVYVQNALHEPRVDGAVYEVAGVAAAAAWFGPRGNLVIVSDPRVDGHDQDVAEHVARSRFAWRIVLGAPAVVDALAARMRRPALTHRDQVYYAGGPADADPRLVRGDVRRAQREDRERLARATLALNASDLNIAPERVDRRWLYGSIDGRTRDGTTRVLGPVGGLWSKLDFGSLGPAGDVLEGVFTFPEQRGRGLGAELVASCMAEAEVGVLLHVAEHNDAARRCYERAGMREAGRCRLLLLG